MIDYFEKIYGKGPIACKHGQLKRSCEICDLHEQLETAERERQIAVQRYERAELAGDYKRLNDLEQQLSDEKKSHTDTKTEWYKEQNHSGSLKERIDELDRQLHQAIAQRDEAREYRAKYEEIVLGLEMMTTISYIKIAGERDSARECLREAMCKIEHFVEGHGLLPANDNSPEWRRWRTAAGETK